MTKKKGSSKRIEQTSESSVSVSDSTLFAPSPPSPSLSLSSISSSSSSSSSSFALVTISDNTYTSVKTITEESSSSSSSATTRATSTTTTSSTSTLTTKAAAPALTVKILEREEFVADTRDGLSSSLTDTTLADIDIDDSLQNEKGKGVRGLGDKLLARANEIEDKDKKTLQPATIENRDEVADAEMKQALSSLEEAQRLRGYGMKGQDWAMLGVLTAATLTVRMWDIQAPGEIVMDEAHVGKYVNGYLTKQFMYDRHPPLGKMLLAGVSSAVSNYSGTFPFEEVGDAYPKDVAIVAMRATIAVMGALCAPMAYITLKSIGQSTHTAIAATILVAFDNALTANNRLMTLDAPLMFFTALSFMSWSMFAKQSFRPFGTLWWTWLAMTGLAVSGALTTKANGVLALLAIGALTAKNMVDLASIRSIGKTLLAKHLISRASLLLLLPVASYIYLFHLHFERQTDRPSDLHSPHSEYDFNLLTYPFRNSLFISSAHSSSSSHGFPNPDLEPMWKDVVYGSVIQLRSELRHPLYLHSFRQRWPKGSTQQQVSGYEYPDLNTNWIIVKVPLDKEKAAGVDEIPSRLRYVRHGDLIKLRHVPTRKCLHSHNVRTIGQNGRDRYCEVSAYGATGMDGDSNDWWTVEVVNGERMEKFPKNSDAKIAALETTIRFKHYTQKCFLSVTDDMLPANIPGGAGRRELACLKEARVNPKSIWRITLNDHDYLPIDTEIASYPEVSFSKKFKELHKLMWSTPRAFEQTEIPTTFTRPSSWPLAMNKNIVHLWRKSSPQQQGVDGGGGFTTTQKVQQISLVANPVVWWTGLLGVVGFLSAHAIIMLREKRGYVSQGPVLEFKQNALSNASIFFVGWAIHYFPYLLISADKHNLAIHHYFPALYFSILLSCTLLTGLSNQVFTGASSANTRLSLWIALSVIAIAVFIQISPFTYGTSITLERYEALEQWIYRKPAQRPSHLAALESNKNHNTTVDIGIFNVSLLFSQRIKLSKPLVRKIAPVLEMHYPSKDEILPRDDIFMTPSQRPPQLWDVNEQKGRPNPYQRQQMHSVLEMVQKEAKEKAEREVKEKAVKEQQGDSRVQQQQQQQQQAKVREQEQALQRQQGPLGDVEPAEINVNEQVPQAIQEDLTLGSVNTLSDQQQDPSPEAQLDRILESTLEKAQAQVLQAEEPVSPPLLLPLPPSPDSAPQVAQEVQEEQTPGNFDSEKKSKFLARLSSNAQSYALQKFTEGHPYGSLDGWGIPRKFDLESDCNEPEFPATSLKISRRQQQQQQLLQQDTKWSSVFTYSRVQKMWQGVKYREKILTKRYRAKLEEDKKKKAEENMGQQQQQQQQQKQQQQEEQQRQIIETVVDNNSHGGQEYEESYYESSNEQQKEEEEAVVHEEQVETPRVVGPLRNTPGRYYFS
ncbi:hypothetical protein BGX26_002724 [Mortierella sp. AD094]|nr:hypothetical protein BGX26_002724 [Mortierella sp. AD094]